MKDELRALGIAHGLLLGLVLASPVIAPSLLPWGAEALFVVAAFQLRLADRRWETRAGMRGWASHIRMSPARLVPWAGTALVAVLAGPEQARIAWSILIAIVLGELLIYPACASLIGRLPRMGLVGVLALLVLGCGLGQPGDPARLAMAFALGMSGCVFWLRGPDGEAGALMAALAGAALAMTCAVLFPASLSFALPAAILSGVLALAHLSVIRRHMQHWRRQEGAHRFTRRPPDPA